MVFRMLLARRDHDSLAPLIIARRTLGEVGFLFSVSPDGHPIDSLTTVPEEAYIHKPQLEIVTPNGRADL